MIPVLSLAVLTALLYFPVVIIDKFRRWQHLRRFAVVHNCKPTRRSLPWDILGLYKIYSAALHVVRGTSLADSTRLFRTHGETYSARMLGQVVFFTCEPRNMRQVLVTRFSDFDSSRGIRDHLFRPITTRGIFVLDGAEWKVARALFRNQFSNTRAIFDLESQERCFRNLEREIAAAGVGGRGLDLQPLFLRLTLDLTTAFAMGVSADSLRPDQAPAKREFVASLMYVKKTIARNGFLGPLHVFLSKTEFHIACGKVHRFVENVIHERLAANKPGKGKTSGRPSCLLDGLIEASKDVVEIRDGVITLLIAGIDSVATLLSTTFFLLAQHEYVFEKLRKSILETAGHEPPTYEQLRRLKYLHHVFNETMRVYPPVPFNARTANNDTYLPTGGGPDGKSSVLVQKGQGVIFYSWGSHRSAESFGMDAHDFRPERWEGGGMQAQALGFIPFNMGPRACPGQHYALAEASYAAVRLIQTFCRIESRDDRGWTEHLGLSLSNKNGTVVELIRDPAQA